MAIEAFAHSEHVKISSAPLVEGAVVAAVEASTGSSLQEVEEAAKQAYMIPKVQGKEG